MSLLGRILNYLDNQTATALDRHLEIAIPSQRKALSPDEIISRYLPSRAQLELVGCFPCCPCDPPGCTDLHRDACPTHQSDGVA